MSAQTHPLSPRGLVARAWSLSPALTVGTGLMVLGAVVSALGLVFDSRQLLGEPVWLKPAKFYISLAVYNATLLYLFAFLSPRRRSVRAMGLILFACGIVEMVAITLQAARGVRSHFNLATALDAALFSSMGIAVATLWGTMLVLTVLLLRTTMADRVLASALRGGVAVSMVGMALGYFMIRPHGEEQLAAMSAGQRPIEVGAHSFGSKDGGPGLPGVGWSTTAGDMRPAHFLGMHAMQGLPLLAALIGRRRRSEASALGLIRASGVAWLGITLVLAAQALRGLPVTQWDAVDLAGLGGVLAVSFLTFALHREPQARLAGGVG